MVEKITSLAELQKKYVLVTGRRPKKGDLVYVPSQQAVFEVQYADRMNVRVERGHKGSGLLLTLPFSHYKLIEKK
ncbi:hypothetical protein ABES03_08675 [Neobacillus rhizosphaerae]|uniref:hypothetical protein n=1 Tax=Neobacillus rhizosphaerae TaxID=2880965 RepID=UPI003D2D6900